MGFLDGLIKLVYPERIVCSFCGNVLDEITGIDVCPKCVSLLTFISDNTCSICGRPYPQGYSAAYCSECSERYMHFDGGCTVFEFSGLVQDMLHKLKYDGQCELASPLGIFMAYRLKKVGWDIDLVVPVPLHHDRLMERGFNQSLLLSMEIGRECGIDVKDGILVRERYTESQVTLSRLERMHNVRGAFGVKNSTRVRKRNILVVDDIMTTGSTLDECSRVLKENGAEKVYCITAACPINVK